MALVKKINSQWVPSENTGIQVGEVMDITNPEDLINQGMAVYVDEKGVEIQRKTPMTLTCPTCTFVTKDQYLLAYHIITMHPRPMPEGVSIPSVTTTPIQELKLGEVTVSGTTPQAGQTVTYMAPPASTTAENLEIEKKIETTEPVQEEKVEEDKKSFKDMTPEEQREWRIANLARGREAAKAKKEAETTPKE